MSVLILECVGLKNMNEIEKEPKTEKKLCVHIKARHQDSQERKLSHFL